MKKIRVNAWGSKHWLDDEAFFNDIQQYISENRAGKIKEQADHLIKDCLFDEDNMREVLINLRGSQDEKIKSLNELYLIDDLVRFIENIENN